LWRPIPSGRLPCYDEPREDTFRGRPRVGRAAPLAAPRRPPARIPPCSYGPGSVPREPGLPRPPAPPASPSWPAPCVSAAALDVRTSASEPRCRYPPGTNADGPVVPRGAARFHPAPVRSRLRSHRRGRRHPRRARPAKSIFDATPRSAFSYRALLADLRARIPQSTPLLHDGPHIVVRIRHVARPGYRGRKPWPMLFRMGPGEHSRARRFVPPLCRSSAGRLSR